MFPTFLNNIIIFVCAIKIQVRYTATAIFKFIPAVSEALQNNDGADVCPAQKQTRTDLKACVEACQILECVWIPSDVHCIDVVETVWNSVEEKPSQGGKGLAIDSCQSCQQ